MSPSKYGMSQFDKSQTSSPYKFSPGKKALTGVESQGETMSVMTGTTKNISPMKVSAVQGLLG